MRILEAERGSVVSRNYIAEFKPKAPEPAVVCESKSVATRTVPPTPVVPSVPSKDVDLILRQLQESFAVSQKVLGGHGDGR